MEELSQLCSTRAIDIQDSTLDKCDFLRQVARFIILNKDYLPDDTRLSLFDAFGKKNESSGTRPSRSRANNARERIEQAREPDIMPSSEILTFVARIRETPSDFWTSGLSVELDWDKNILRHIYHGNRQNDKLAVTYRAFYTTATYLFIRSICEAFNVRIFTDRVLHYCTALVDPRREEDTELVKQNLKDDYKAGLIWNTYAEHLGGYGAFFLIGVAPTWLFEITLSQSDDLRFAVSHFKLINVPQTAVQYNLHAVGSKIILEITRRVGSSLPQKRSKEKRQNKKNKISKSSRSRTAKSGAGAELLERFEDGLASHEIRVSQDDHSSVHAEMNQRQPAQNFRPYSHSSHPTPEIHNSPARVSSQACTNDTGAACSDRENFHSSIPCDNLLSSSNSARQIANESMAQPYSAWPTNEEQMNSASAAPSIYDQSTFNPHCTPGQGPIISGSELTTEYTGVPTRHQVAEQHFPQLDTASYTYDFHNFVPASSEWNDWYYDFSSNFR